MKMDKPAVSIVMPVYNPGIYFEECLKTVFAQTFTDFELICVNDASKDSLTLQILETYQNRYSNMKVLHLEQNVGAGEARNLGFKVAVGEYIIFLDSDDVYDKELLERMYMECIKTDADVCICGFTRFDSQDEKREVIYEWKPDISKLEDKEKETYFLSWSMGPWDKLCKRKFLAEYNIYFQSLSPGDDLFYSLMIAKEAVKKAYIEESWLIKSRKNIPTQITANHDPRNIVHAAELMKCTMRQRNQYDKVMQTQLSLYMIFRVLDEMKYCRDDHIKRQSYHLMRHFLQQHQISNDHKILYALYCNIMKQPYESRWFEPEIGYLWELQIYSEELKECISDKQHLFLWGLGKRGEAFQEFCIEENIVIQGVTDKINTNIGNTTKYGNKILSTDEVMYSKGFIIASNENIYHELIDMKLKANILNLEKYCPI